MHLRQRGRVWSEWIEDLPLLLEIEQWIVYPPPAET